MSSLSVKLLSKVRLNAEINLIDSIDVGIVTYPINFVSGKTFDNGIGAAFSDTRTILAGGSEDLDLSGGIFDVFGNAIVFTKIKDLIIYADSENINDVLVGGASSNQLDTFFGDSSDIVRVKPGGTFALIATKSAGYEVTLGTGDILKIANSSGGTSVTYKIIATGTIKENNIFNGSFASIEVSGTVNTII